MRPCILGTAHNQGKTKGRDLYYQNYGTGSFINILFQKFELLIHTVQISYCIKTEQKLLTKKQEQKILNN